MELISSCKTEAWGFASYNLKCGFKLTEKNEPFFGKEGGNSHVSKSNYA